MYGKSYEGIIRSTFIISETGAIEKVIEKVKTLEHAKQILEQVWEVKSYELVLCPLWTLNLLSFFVLSEKSCKFDKNKVIKKWTKKQKTPKIPKKEKILR